MRADEYWRGYKDASKKAVARIHELAAEMNDPKARQVLNSAGFELGVMFSRERKKSGTFLKSEE